MIFKILMALEESTLSGAPSQPLITLKPDGNTARSRFLLRHLLPLSLYLLGALIFTWPLALHLGDRVIAASGGDTWQHLWHTWWIKHSLLDLKALPFYTDMLYYPQRVDLLLDSLNITTGIISIPLQLVFGLVLSFNLIILGALTLSGYTAYRLAGYLCGNYLAAFVAGVVYAFCPLVALWLNLGQLDLIPAFWFPLFILAYLKVLRRENWRWNVVGAVVCFMAMSLTSWYFTYFGLIFSGLALLYYLFQQRKEWRGVALRGIGTLAAAGLILAPVLQRTLSATGGEQNVGQQTYYNLWLNSAALTDFIKPGPSAIWSIFGTRENSDYQWLFLGFAALALALLGLISYLKQTWFWGVVGLVFFELSLGPTLRLVVKDEVLAKPADAEAGLPTLNRLLYALPFGNIARIPLVSVIALVLVVGILAAFGTARLLTLKRVPPRFAWVTVAVAAGFIFLEFLPLPRQLADTAYPQFYRQLAADRGDFAVLDLPDKSEAIAMYYQTYHAKPMVGGYTARKPPYPFAVTPGIKELRSTYPSTLPRDIFDPATLNNTPAMLNYYNIQYAIFHQELADVSEAYKQGELEYINSVFGGAKPFYQDDKIMVWRVRDLPNATTACGAKAILPGRMGGWNEREVNDKNEVQRWTDGNAEVNFFNPTRQTVNLLIETEAQSWQQTRRLQVWQDNKVVQEAPVGTGRGKIQLKLTLPPGPNRVQFKTVEPGVKEGGQVRAILFYTFKFSDAELANCKQ